MGDNLTNLLKAMFDTISIFSISQKEGTC